MRLILVRHGDAHAGFHGVIGGRTGCTGLTPHGRAQAEALRDHLADSGRVRVNPVRSQDLVWDLDTLPMPAWDLLPNPRYWKIARPHSGIFEPGEFWDVIIDDYFNTAGIGPAEFRSIGVGFASPGPPSSGSIIGIVPEPASLGMAMGAGVLLLMPQRRRGRSTR